MVTPEQKSKIREAIRLLREAAPGFDPGVAYTVDGGDFSLYGGDGTERLMMRLYLGGSAKAKAEGVDAAPG